MEPVWLQQRREKAAQEFAHTPLPVLEEFWRRTRLDRLQLDRYAPLSASQNGAIQGSASRLLPVSLQLSGEILYGEKTSPARLDASCLKQGVVLTTLSQAAQEFPELVNRFLGKGFQGRHEKFLLQNEAYWQSGVFCYLPKNVVIEAPILLTSFFEGSGKGIFPRLLLVADAGSKATVIHYAASESRNGESNFTNSVAEVYLEEGADLNFIDLQSLSGETIEIALKRTELAKESQLHWILDLQGGKVSKTNIETVLNGANATAGVYGLVCGRGRQHLEIYSKTQHIAPHTTADILVKGTAQDRAKTIFQGMIRIEKSAQQTESYMANHNLVLSEKAHADSIPRLEIEADDVKASHGASIGQVDKEQLFYLRSKGLDAEAAERLLVEGFYEEIFGKIPLGPIRELMRTNLEKKKEAAHDTAA